MTTDHGRNATTGKDHGGQSDRERTTWIATNSKDLNERFKQSLGIVDIFAFRFHSYAIVNPDEVAEEIDGVPFIRPIDLAELIAEKNGNSITLRIPRAPPQEKSSRFIRISRSPKRRRANGTRLSNLRTKRMVAPSRSVG